MSKAKAPRPGVSRRNEEAAENQKILTITTRRELTTAKGRAIAAENTLAINNLPMRERLICRKATGLPFASFWSEDRIDIDSVVVLWWLARRAQGEVNLTFDGAVKEWPDDMVPVNEETGEGDFDLEFDDNDEDEGGDDPEG